jgi:hypothetical protein
MRGETLQLVFLGPRLGEEGAVAAQAAMGAQRRSVRLGEGVAIHYRHLARGFRRRKQTATS